MRRMAIVLKNGSREDSYTRPPSNPRKDDIGRDSEVMVEWGEVNRLGMCFRSYD